MSAPLGGAAIPTLSSLISVAFIVCCLLPRNTYGYTWSDTWPQGRGITPERSPHKKLRPAPYHSAQDNVELLSWAVKLALPTQQYSKEELDSVADIVATEMGVKNRGQIGSLPGHYLFTHELHDLTASRRQTAIPCDNPTNGCAGNQFLRYVSYDNIGAISRDKFIQIMRDLHDAMDGHAHIEWFTPQTVRSRQKRAIPQRDVIKYINSQPTNKHSMQQRHGLQTNHFPTINKQTDGILLEISSKLKANNDSKIDLKSYPHTDVSRLKRSTIRRHAGLARHFESRDLEFEDPQYMYQWHLHNTIDLSMDINVTGIWERNIRGQGVTVCVIDDGLQWTSPDLRDNYSPEGSWDLNGDDSDPMPDPHDGKNHHGTRCAGEISAVANDYCGVGVAYQSKISGIRMLDGPMTDSMEASAFTTAININDVFSCSWGPDDDGKTVDGPHYLAHEAIRHGVNYGRHGYGNIYVVASGNGGRFGDNCNFDGYANSMYTITIGAVDETGNMPYYAEECASMLAVTFSSGDGYHRSIVTTDWTMNGAAGCTSGHTGTSAAAPLAAGLVALVLQVRPCLTWRDIQYLIILTALKVDRDEGHWHKNGAGLTHSHRHGFGLMHAWRLVNAAKSWEPVPWLTGFSSGDINENLQIPRSPAALSITYPVNRTTLDGYWLETLEHVQVTLTLEHPSRGDLQITLLCPSGTESYLATRRTLDRSDAGFQGWTFSTVRCWGEPPEGNWTLIIQDKGRYGTGTLVTWNLKLMGTPQTVEQFQQRRQNVADAISGSYVDRNISAPCAEPLQYAPLLIPISEKTLKIICLVSIFCLVLGMYETMEYAFCYDDEKEEYRRMVRLQMRANRLMNQSASQTGNQATNQSATETTHLLGGGGRGEAIPLQTFSRTDSIDGATMTNDDRAPLLPNGDVPPDILKTLSPEEIRLNMSVH